jgi:two-component system NtrC family sensor kinase
MQADAAPAVRPGKSRKLTARLLRIACVVLPAVLFGGLSLIDYRLEAARTRNDAMTASNAVAEHARTVVETVDLVIARVLDHIGEQDWPTLATSLETHVFLDRLRHELPQVEAVYLIDPNGFIAASSRAYPMPRFDVRNAEYFAAVKANNSDAMVISAPFAKTISGTTGFMISRRRMLDGKFDGVVGVTVSRQYFDDFYRAILDHPTASAAGIIRTDGAVLVRFPDLPDRLITLPATNPVLVAVRSGRESGLVAGRSDQDGKRRISGFRRLHGLPIIARYGINRSVLLTNWALHSAVIGVCAMLLSALLLATEHLARRRTAIEHAGLRRLVEETERRRQAEAMVQQSQKMEALGRLTGGVAHDFNNLLAVILGSLELVLRRENDPRSRRLLEAASKAAERGAKLTAQMLAFSRKQEVSVEPIDVNAAIQGMDDLLRRTLGPAVQLHYDLCNDLWPGLADSMQLEMALLNLAVNARDAMPNGGELIFRTVAMADPEGLDAGDYVCVQVIDTGAGMPEEVRARAQEPFFTTKGPGGGTGLGLSMVAGFLSDVGGGLTLASAPGCGTTVTLFLRKADHAPQVATPPTNVRAASTHLGRVLLVDDDISVRLSVRAMLEELGHAVVEADGGADALRILERDRRFDLLIIDFAMPLMNGAQLAAEVTRVWLDAPILFVTGYVDNDALRPWSELDYQTVQKPFSTQVLASAIERAMRQPAYASRGVGESLP